MSSEPKQFQINAADKIAGTLEKNSRAFLADEAGLGKTYTSTLVAMKLAKRQWTRQKEQGLEPTPFFMLYVGPNQALLEKCCNDIVNKYHDMQNLDCYQDFKEVPIHDNHSRYDRLSVLKDGSNVLEGPYFYDKTFQKVRGQKIILFATSIGVMGKTAMGITGNANEYRLFCNSGSNDFAQWRIQREKQVLARFGLVIFDEYHRYFGKIRSVEEAAVSVYEIERWKERQDQLQLKCLFVSATPFSSKKGDGNSKSDLWSEEDEGISSSAIPGFEQFASDLVCQGIRNQPYDSLNDKKSAYTQAVNDYLKDSQNEKLRENALTTKEAYQGLLSRFMVRNERTLLSGGKNAEKHIDLYENLEIRDYSECIRNMYRQRLNLMRAMYPNGALEWSMDVPWILSFSTFYKTPKYFELLKPGAVNPKTGMKQAHGKRILMEELFLYKETEDGVRYDADKMKSLPEQNIAMKQMIDANLTKEMSQLLWVPPTIPKYTVDSESIYTKQKDYSKLLVFCEYRFMQRGGAALLSDYADFLNSPRKEDLEKQVPEEPLKIPVPEKADEIPRCHFPQMTDLDEWLKKEEAVSVHEKLIQIASPYYCARAYMGGKHEHGKKVHKAFEHYINRPEIKKVLWKWIQENKERMSNLGITGTGDQILYYFAEGNYEAMMEELLFCTGVKGFLPTLETVLNRSSGVVHVQTNDTYQVENPKDGFARTCGFAERLSKDLEDNGTASGTKSELSHKGLCDAFNSPFYPMILLAGRGAQEGLDFHYYCQRIMHETLPRGAVSFDQRQGRIDRFHSLLTRRRAVEVIQNQKNDGKIAGWDQIFSGVKELAECDHMETWEKDQLFPDWQIKEHDSYKSKYHFERILPVIPYTDDYEEYQKVKHVLKSYRSVIGSSDIEISDPELIVNLST